ncbi:MAG: hypothetical protein OEZ16_08805, partial [Chromatiales bacterium]|nr:hypothetical protein [Chromatiales bacterium]
MAVIPVATRATIVCVIPRAIASAVLLSAVTVGAVEIDYQGQDLSVEHQPQQYVYPDPEIPNLTDLRDIGVNDSPEARLEQQMWDLLGAGELVRLRSVITTRQREIVGWQPPAWLTVELARAELGVAVDAVRHNPPELLSLFAQHPEVFSCRYYYNLWSLADAYRATGQVQKGATIHRQMLQQCRREETLLVTLDRIGEYQGKERAMVAAEALLSRQDRSLPRRSISDKIYHWRVAKAGALRDAQRREAATSLLAIIADEVVQRRDLKVARMVAWNYREREQNREAILWFSRVAEWGDLEQDRLHLQQTRWESGDRDGVIFDVTSSNWRNNESRIWVSGTLREQAVTLYNSGNFQRSLKLLELAEELSSDEPVSVMLLHGWNLYQLERFDESYGRFVDAYLRSQSHAEQLKGVEGLLYASMRSGDWKRVLKTAEEHRGPLLSTEAERELAEAVSEGRLVGERLSVTEGRLVQAADNRRTGVVGMPGYLWGGIRNDTQGLTTHSYVVNQGVDWLSLPGDVLLNTFIEIRSFDSEWRSSEGDRESVVGIAIKRAPFQIGAEYFPSAWGNDKRIEGRWSGFFGWYGEWESLDS